MSYCHLCRRPHLYETDGDDGWRFDNRAMAMVCPSCQVLAREVAAVLDPEATP